MFATLTAYEAASLTTIVFLLIILAVLVTYVVVGMIRDQQKEITALKAEIAELTLDQA